MSITPENAPQNTTVPQQSSAVAVDSVAALVQEQPQKPKPEVRVVFFCKDCEKIVVGIKVGNKYVYKCPLCHTKNVAFGTEKSIRSFYRVKDEIKPTAQAPR